MTNREHERAGTQGGGVACGNGGNGSRGSVHDGEVTFRIAADYGALHRATVRGQNDRMLHGNDVCAGDEQVFAAPGNPGPVTAAAARFVDDRDDAGAQSRRGVAQKRRREDHRRLLPLPLRSPRGRSPITTSTGRCSPPRTISSRTRFPTASPLTTSSNCSKLSRLSPSIATTMSPSSSPALAAGASGSIETSNNPVRWPSCTGCIAAPIQPRGT